MIDISGPIEACMPHMSGAQDHCERAISATWRQMKAEARESHVGGKTRNTHCRYTNATQEGIKALLPFLPFLPSASQLVQTDPIVIAHQHPTTSQKKPDSSLAPSTSPLNSPPSTPSANESTASYSQNSFLSTSTSPQTYGPRRPPTRPSSTLVSPEERPVQCWVDESGETR